MTQLCRCLENATDENCHLAIGQLLREGRENAAFHIFLAIANNLKNPPKKETLIALLGKIERAAGLAPIEEKSGYVINESDLVHGASIKLENALGYFIEPTDTRLGVIPIQTNARRVLRLYRLYGEPTPRSQTAREIGVQKPDLCLKHIPHPAQFS